MESEKYNFKKVEQKWQKFWEDQQSFQTEKNNKKKNIIA